MPLLGGKVQCYKCSKDESFMWHPSPRGIQCNDCHETEHTVKVVEEEEKKPAPVEKPKPSTSKRGNKSARSYKTRQNPNAVPKQYSRERGRGRRSIFKKKEPMKLSASPATYTTSTCVFYKESVWRSGDIVSIRDVEGGIYYARLDLFLTDMYCETSASISWLLPTRDEMPFKKDGFDPMTYVLGPHDDLPRKLDYFEFVMHCPSDYYQVQTPFPGGKPPLSYSGYIWDRLHSKDNIQKK